MSCGVGFVCDIKGRKSHDIVRRGIEAVKNLTHRGAVGADGKTGDGAGILTQIPKRFFLKEIEKSGHRISNIDNLAVGVFFFLSNPGEEIESSIEKILNKYGFKTIGRRDVPTNDDALGQAALFAKPEIRQLLIDSGGVEKEKRELNLYLARRMIEKTYGERVYIPSLSTKTIVYKGMLVAPHLDDFYPDLKNEDFESAFCIFHQRFSTNTFPDWTMAQPFRVLAHNGEINTIQGNRNWMATIEHEIGHEIFGDDGELLRPLISFGESDSSSLDRMIELLMLAGFSPEHAINLCIPPAWEDSVFDDDEKAFFEYQSLLMKPWDGPAAVAFTDGNTVLAHLDRNGLRPLRYVVTEEGIIVLGSEAGMVDLGGKTIKEKGRLGPGDTLSIDLTKGELRHTDAIIKGLARHKSYKEWIGNYLYRLPEEAIEVPASDGEILRKQIAFGYTSEEIGTSIKEMAETAKELIFSMGDDTPLPPLSEKPQVLFRYFKQRFSQVTNPPIDPIRERMVMSLTMNLGYKRNFLIEFPEHAKRLHLDSPLLFGSQIREIEAQGDFKIERIPITYSKSGMEELSKEGLTTCCVPGQACLSLPDRQAGGRQGSLLAGAVGRLRIKVAEAVRNGAEVIILSDRDISKERVAIPGLLAVSASFKSLQRERIANRVSLIIETGEARDVHHVACLLGYGASAVHPYLVLQIIGEMCGRGEVRLPVEKAMLNYKKAVGDGLLKIIARMGISTLNSYYGAQIFDIICLKSDFVEEYFGGTPFSIESDGLFEIEESLIRRHDAGFGTPEPKIDFGGDLRHRKEGEWHAWSPSSVIALNKFIKGPDHGLYEEFSRIANERPVFLRHLLSYKKGDSVPVEEVEPEESILKRFFSGAMSVGALSPEAHETIAEACNRLGIKSNSGEGGEDPARYWTTKNSAIKQIASGRFGVTPTYIASASDLEIKIAQGAKPGEGGHLPEKKVTEYIAALRHCNPGILLISPPPHHDIYSIEDLAQLINDLKQANPRARVCVKLVSETGVGTVAAGVAKAYADIIQICGCEGGTGAAAISSIKNVGNYWEVGLAETQRVLIENGLRERVRLRVDGGLRTGKDVLVAALLGAEEFGFGTATMIAAGCVMARQCHLNTCPTGIATQDPRLRQKFRGKVEAVATYFRDLAQEVRRILAGMGVRSLDEITGRSDLLVFEPGSHPDARRIKIDSLLEGYAGERPRRCTSERNDNPSPSMNDRLVKDLLPYIEKAEPIEREYEIRNIDRSIPLQLNYHIALRYRDEGLPEDTLRLTFRGTAGQSFGAFNHRGLSLTLIGEASDYVAKSMYGGRIVIRPHREIGEPHRQVIVGNTVLYGATGGELFVSGLAGERFGVRNSGAVAVVEGAGHHLCEYMTRGTVVVLGEAGRNIGAGMTGGVIYLFDEAQIFGARLNNTYVKGLGLEDGEEIESLRALLERHRIYTGSSRADEILSRFEVPAQRFIKVVPLSPSP